ncbi:sensor histidine kinase [Clostridium sartagoforme]|uniref:sensor histidine kinase n=1 Tax=Clostridium sartagoforme TaxID=84031 RepID=UPI0031E36D12
MPSLYFKTNAKVEKLVGRELITNSTIAIFELVKNSYDAGASEVEIKFVNFDHNDGNRSKLVSKEDSYIEIIDNGKGMTLKEIEDNWMELGTSYKEKNKVEEIRIRKEQIEIISKRHVNGEKGIGRFGVDKVGSVLVMESIDKNLQNKCIVKFNWDDFEDRDKLIEEIPCTYEIRNVESNESAGLKLKIMNLRDRWFLSDIDKLRMSLKKFLSPIEIEQDEFRILFTYPKKENNIISNLTEQILNDSFEYLKTKIYAKIDKDGNMYYEIQDNGEIKISTEKNIYDKSPFGEVEVTIYYLNKTDKGIFTRSMGLPTHEYGNIKIFRDNFRIMPYGESHNDWLEIDNKHSQGVFRTFGTRDLVGYILLSHDESKGNNILKEATDRVGLIEDVPEFSQLKELVWKIIGLLQSYIFDKLESESRETSEILRNESTNLKAETTNFIENFKKIINKVDIPHTDKSELIAELKYNSDKLMNNIEKVETASKEIDKKIKIYSQITGAEGVLFNTMHKIKNKLAIIDAQLEDLDIDLKISKIEFNTKEIKIAFNTIQKMVDGSLKIIKAAKAKKSNFNVKDLVDETIRNHASRLRQEGVVLNNVFQADNVEIKGNKEALQINVFENLFDNSFKALSEIKDGEITIETKINNGFVEIYFSDNGKGIPEDKIPFIFALWGSNTDGSGIGLATARDAVKDHEGEIMCVNLGEENKKTTFLIKLPIIGGRNKI